MFTFCKPIAGFVYLKFGARFLNIESPQKTHASAEKAGDICIYMCICIDIYVYIYVYIYIYVYMYKVYIKAYRRSVALLS